MRYPMSTGPCRQRARAEVFRKLLKDPLLVLGCDGSNLSSSHGMTVL